MTADPPVDPVCEGQGRCVQDLARESLPKPGSAIPARIRGANLDPMASGSEHLRPNLHEYLVAHSSPPDALLRDLIAETAARFPELEK